MSTIELRPDGESAVATFDGDWLLEIRRHELATSPVEARTPDGESFLLVLAGTHDLYAGGGSWMQRGLRPEPYAGRPVGIFLPPSTPYKLENGTGRAIVISARQPELPEPDSPKESLSKKPLLQMSGSGKAFDPATGTWKPKEAFLSSPEAILPRRIAKLDVDGVTVQRILDVDYKALGLCLDEVALGDGQSVCVPELAGSIDPCEIAVYYETEGELTVDGRSLTGAGVARLSGGSIELSSVGGRSYAAIAYAGPKALAHD